MPKTPDLFSDVRWSSEHTLKDTLGNLEKRKVKVALVETLEDIDDAGAYGRWRINDK